MSGVWMFCLLYGAAWCLFAPTFTVPLLAPIVILAALVVWSLPDTRRAPVHLLAPWFLVAATAQVVWPNYLAIALPGLPWVTVSRLIQTPLAVMLLVCVSTSREFRTQSARILRASRPIVLLVIAYNIFLVIGVLDSAKMFFSFDRFFQLEVSLTAVFFISAYVFTQPGYASRWLGTLWVAAVLVSVLALYESRLRHVPWAGHIPSFLQIDNPLVDFIVTGQRRGAAYRAQGTFDGPIELSEFLSFMVAFIVHWLVRGKNQTTRTLALISLPIIIGSQIISGSRSGLIGTFMAPLMYAFVYSMQVYQVRRTRLLGYALMIFYPTGAVSALAMSFVVPPLYHRMWVSSGSASSDQSRVIQWGMGIPKILARPWGYGVARSAEVLGYYTPGGQLSIDSYYLAQALDLGIVGASIFFVTFAFAAARAVIFGSRVPIANTEESLLIPAGISLVNFLIIKSVFAQGDNHMFFFATLGMIVALVFRAQQAPPSVQDKGQEPAVQARVREARPVPARA